MDEENLDWIEHRRDDVEDVELEREIDQMLDGMIRRDARRNQGN